MMGALGKHRLRRFLLLGGVVIILPLSLFALPWKIWFADRIKHILAAQGVQDIQLTVSSIGLTSVTLKDVSIGSPSPIVLKNMTLDYALSDVWGGRARALTLTDLAFDIRQTQDRWQVVGLENWRSGSTTSDVALPVTKDELNNIPLSAVTVQDSHVHIATDSWQADMPLDISWRQNPVPMLAYHGSGLSFRANDINVTVGNVALTASISSDHPQWNGSGRLDDIQLTGGDHPVPPLIGNGHFVALADHTIFDGHIQSSDHAYKVIFHADYFLNKPEQSNLTIIDATIPWNGGTIATHSVHVPFQRDQAISVNVDVQHISADALIRQLTGDKATATGVISGSLPVTIEKDGTFTLHQGTLRNEAPGSIQMSPETIPGDNDQITLVREMLKNFRYTFLAMTLESHKDNRIEVHLSLEGRNPQASARPAKININLNGDVLPLLQKNLPWFTNPKKFLEDNSNAKQ